ncbi:TorF family putative porin [Tabrizicola sp. YIM 78059]|uniref:TorF family putative porin n=1 Tax=Tabrizicola sp. YIM 78059 TaxID=2529861 RepID=UPI0010A9DF7E|nr:TorF family putative porin [Tabrizicola sp. YIM 78059]
MRMIAGVAVLAFSAGMAGAQGFELLGGAKLEYKHKEEGGSSNAYLSGYIEGEAVGFYVGIWGQVASDDLLDEVDLYLGYRNETAGGLTYDVGYTRYYYPNDGGECCGEYTLALGMPLGPVTGKLDLAHDPQSDLNSAYLGAAWSATDALEVSGQFGIFQVEDAGSEREWDLGMTYSLGRTTAVDFRYYDGSDYADSHFGLALTWDSTLLSR